MTSAELQAFKVRLLGNILEIAIDPIPDVDNIMQDVEDFISQLEAEHGTGFGCALGASQETPRTD